MSQVWLIGVLAVLPVALSPPAAALRAVPTEPATLITALAELDDAFEAALLDELAYRERQMTLKDQEARHG